MRPQGCWRLRRQSGLRETDCLVLHPYGDQCPLGARV